MAATNKHKATITLGLVSLGFVASYPFSHSFIGGAITSGCSAALVGGLADWFAVSALFRKPMGIPFRTEIIPRNRDRIAQAMIEMVEGELLTRENIRDTLQRYDIAALILRYLTEYGGKNHIEEFLHKIAGDIFAKINPDKIARFLAALIQENSGRILLARPLSQALNWSLKHGYIDKLADFILGELSLLVRQPQIQPMLVSLFDEARVVYEKDMQRRRLAGQIIEQLGMTSAHLAGLLQQKAGQFLLELQQSDHPLRLELKQKAADFASRLATDPILQADFERRKDRFISEYPDLAPRISGFVKSILAAVSAESGQAVTRKWVGYQIDLMITGIGHSNSQQEVLGRLIKQGLQTLIDTHHSKIGTIVRERINQFSTPALVEFIETRVGNDLQMIRINGSVVGGLVGTLIFLLTYWWQLW